MAFDTYDGNIAVVHGDYSEHGGAEKVSRELARTFAAPFYYGFGLPEEEVNGEDLPTDTVESLFNDSTLSFVKNSIFLRDLFYMAKGSYLPTLTDYDVLVMSKNELGWYVPEDEQVLIRYLHTTPRTPYDQFQEKGGSLARKGYAFAARVLMKHTTPFADRYIVNSELVKRRAQRYWDIPEEKIDVVYPPVDVNDYESFPTEDYYLTFSRLIPEKRTGDIIEAFNELDMKLVVGGKGYHKDKLEKMADDNIEFVGFMSEEEKKRRLGEAKAVVFNAFNEDFGLVPVEAFAAGTPVLGVADGYTKYQIVDGKNGYLHPYGVEADEGSWAQTPAECIRQSVQQFETEGVELSSDEIQGFAERFGVQQFRDGVKQSVMQAIADADIDPYNGADIL